MISFLFFDHPNFFLSISKYNIKIDSMVELPILALTTTKYTNDTIL